MPLIRRAPATSSKVVIQQGETSSSSYTSDQDSYPYEGDDYSYTEEDEFAEEDEFDEDLHPSDSASTTFDNPLPSRHQRGQAVTRGYRPPQNPQQYRQVPPRAPQAQPTVAHQDDYGHYGHGGYAQPGHSGHFGSRHHGTTYYPNHGGQYGNAFPNRQQMVPIGNYGNNPFNPVGSGANGGGYFGDQSRMYEMMPYQQPGAPAYYGAHHYNLPPHMQQFQMSGAPPLPSDPPAQVKTPGPGEAPDPEKLRLEAELKAMRAHEEKLAAAEKQKELEAQIRKDAEDAFQRRMEDMRKAQEDAKKEIEKAKAEAEKAARERIEAERKAEEERKKAHADAMARAEENARKKFEAEMKAAEERRKKEEEERKRAEEAARIRLEIAIKAEADAKAAAEKKAAEEVERLKKIQEDAKVKAELEAAKKVEADKKAAAEKAEAEATAKKDAEALKKKIQEETKASYEEQLKKKADKAPIRFKDAVGRKFSFPFHLCQTWQGMEDLIKQAFMQVDVLGPHVQEGHYDLIGPNGEIILPTVWERVIQPDWQITMTMWPMDKAPPFGPRMPGGINGRPGISIPPPPGGFRGGRGMGVGMAPPSGWDGPNRRRPDMPAGVDIINAAPKDRRKDGKRNSAMLTFLAGKPKKKSSGKK